MSEHPEVIARIDGSAGRVTLNRPRALNALTAGMCETINEALLAWLHDDAVRLVLIDHAGERGFCAGVVDQHQPDSVVVQPGQQGLVDRLAHAGGERVQRPWPVQRHPTGGPVDTGNDFRVLAHRFRSSMGTALRVDADSMALSRDASVAPSVSASRR